jgi:hypothetical protein
MRSGHTTKGDQVTGKINHRRAVGIATAVLTLGVAGPAAARPFDINSTGSFVPANVGQTPAVAAPAPHANGGGSAVEYALIGTGGASVLLVGVGGTLAASRRRQAGAARRSTLVT